MYIKLIQPQMKKRPMDTDLKIHMSPPLGLYTIANMINGNHTVSVENENIQKIVWDDNPDIVGITVTVDTMPRAMEIARKFREQGITVVAGGIYITTAYKLIQENIFDALCIGAAEDSWDEIISDCENGRLKQIYKCHGTNSATKIVSPAYNLLKSKHYLYYNIMHTSRGCPFKCDFCYNSAKNAHYVNRPIEDLLKEIELIGSKHIMFIDDNFIGNTVWTNSFLDAIMPLKLKWNAAVSVNIAEHLDLLDKMKQSGCQSLFIGFESINPHSLISVNKTQNKPSQYEIAVKEIHDRGIMINASFVFGLDEDTPKVFENTLDWIVKNKIETVTSHILTPYPGTKLYEKLSAENRILTDDLSLYNTANVVFQPKNMSQAELYAGYIGIYKNIYSIKNIFKRMPKCKKQKLPYLMFNLFYRKFGKLTDLLCKAVSYKFVGFISEKISKYI